MNRVTETEVVTYLDTHLKFFGVRPLAKALHISPETLTPLLKHLNDEHKICRSGRVEYTSYCSLLLSRKNAHIAVEKIRQARPPREEKTNVVKRASAELNKTVTLPATVSAEKIGIYSAAPKKKPKDACFSVSDEFFKDLLNKPAEHVPSNYYGRSKRSYKGLDPYVVSKLHEYHYAAVPTNITLTIEED